MNTRCEMDTLSISENKHTLSKFNTLHEICIVFVILLRKFTLSFSSLQIGIKARRWKKSNL